MSGQAREKRTCSLVTESTSYRVGRLQPQDSKARHQQGISGEQRNGAEYLWREFFPMLDERPHQLSPRFSVDAQRTAGLIQATFQHHGGAVIKRMRQRSGGVNPFQAVVAQWQ